jgi:hypothetical protein
MATPEERIKAHEFGRNILPVSAVYGIRSNAPTMRVLLLDLRIEQPIPGDRFLLLTLQSTIK